MKPLLPFLCALLLPAALPAALIYQTGFETGDSAGFVVGSTFSGVDTWSLNFANQATIVSSPVAAGSQAAQITATNPDAPATKRNVLASRLIDATPGDGEVVRFQISALATSDSVYTATISLGGAGAVGTNVFAGVQFNNGTFRYRTVGDGVYVNIGAYTANTFYTFTFDLNVVEGSYSLTIDGGAYSNHKIEDIDYVNGGNGALANVFIIQNTLNETLTFDQLSVSTVAVPEGGTAALLLLPVAGIAGRRWLKGCR